ncbi:hypothetical protein [Thermocatellispora tengchongensis]
MAVAIVALLVLHTQPERGYGLDGSSVLLNNTAKKSRRDVENPSAASSLG